MSDVELEWQYSESAVLFGLQTGKPKGYGRSAGSWTASRRQEAGKGQPQQRLVGDRAIDPT